MKRRFLSILLCLVMLAGTIPISAAADEATDGQNNEINTYAGAADSMPFGNGTQESPYLITSVRELEWFRDKVNGGETEICARLMSDIKFAESVNASNWTAIGSAANHYSGTFDGNNYNINTAPSSTDSIKWNLSTESSGLFGYIGEKGTVKSLNTMIKATAGNSTALLAYENHGTVELCTVRTILLNEDDVGADTPFCNFAYKNYGSIKNCLSILQQRYENTCGFVNFNYGTIESSLCAVVNGRTRGTSVYAIAKDNTSGTVKNCYCTCTDHTEIIKDVDNIANGKIYGYEDGLKYLEEDGKGALLKKITWLINNNGSADGSNTDPWRYGSDAGGYNRTYPTLNPLDQKVTKSDGSETYTPHTHRVDGVIKEFVEPEIDLYRLDKGDSGCYYITEDISFVNGWEIPDNITLCLNGHSVKNNGGSVIVPGGINFAVTDCQETAGKITSDQTGVTVEGGSFVLENASITGCATGIDYKSGAVKLGGKAKVTGNTQKNIKLAKDRKLTFGQLDSSARFGITYDGTVAKGDKVAITDKTGVKYALQLSSDSDELVLSTSDDAVVLTSPEEHSHCICGAEHKEISGTEDDGTKTGHISEEAVTFKPWNPYSHTDADGNPTMPTEAGSYYLTQSVELADKACWEPSGDVKLCLNGYTLTVSYADKSDSADPGLILLDEENDSLTVTDCKDTGKITLSDASVDVARKNCVRIINGAEYNLYGGTMTNFARAVSIGDEYNGANSGTFNMYGGKFTGNVSGTFKSTGFGSAVYANGSSAKIVMYDGEIVDNKTAGMDRQGRAGGGVYVANMGSFIMHNGKISGNGKAVEGETNEKRKYGAADGGGVYVNGTFIMKGGEISNNMVTDNFSYATTSVGTKVFEYTARGGGVFVSGLSDTQKGILKITGGKIQNNAAIKGIGGGICIDNNVDATIENAVISGNKAEGTKTRGYYGGGGGIFSRAGFTIKNSTVSDNSLNISTGDYNYVGGGAGVFVSNGSRINNNAIIEGCTISGNKLTGKSTARSDRNDIIGGAAVCVPYGNTEIKDSAITGNAATSDSDAADGEKLKAGGVFVGKNAAITLTGKVVITGNTADGGKNNTYLEYTEDGSRSGGYIQLPGALADGSNIGFTAHEGGAVPIIFASGTDSYTVTAADAKRFCDDGERYAPVLDGNNIQFTDCAHTDVGENGKCSGCGKQMYFAAVEIGGAVTNYENIYDALEAVKACTAADNATVKLLCDIKPDRDVAYDEYNSLAKLVISGGTFTIDFNGHEISFFNEDYYPHKLLYISGGNVTLKNGTMTSGIADTEAAHSYKADATVVAAAGTLHIDNMTITGSDSDFVIDVSDSAEATISNSNILGKNDMSAVGVSGGKVNITSGTYTSDRMGVVSAFSSGSELNISGGTFKRSRDVDDFGDKCYALILEMQTNVKLTGGTFDGIYIPDECDYSTTPPTVVTPGYPISTVIADGYALCKEDGALFDASVNKTQETVHIDKHTSHNFDKNGKCGCGYACDHSDIETDSSGKAVCTKCGAGFAVKIENGDTVTYGTDINAALENAADGSKLTVVSGEKTLNIKDELYVPNNTAFTLDINGHSLAENPVKIGKTTSSNSRLTVLDTAGNGEISFEIWKGNALELRPKDNSTKINYIGYFGGDVKFYGGNIEKNQWQFNDAGTTKLTDLLPEGYAYRLYEPLGAYSDWVKSADLQGNDVKTSLNLAIVKCSHPGASDACEYCGAHTVAKVTKDGKDSFYTELNADAIAVANGGTLTLIGDASADDTFTVENSKLTLDLGGHKLTHNSSGKLFDLKNGADVTVVDSSEAASGEIYTEGYAFYTSGTAIFTVNSGRIAGSMVMVGVDDDSADSYALYAEGGTVNITGGTFENIFYICDRRNEGIDPQVNTKLSGGRFKHFRIKGAYPALALADGYAFTLSSNKNITINGYEGTDGYTGAYSLADCTVAKHTHSCDETAYSPKCPCGVDIVAKITAKDGTNSYITALDQSAVDAANGGKITILRNFDKYKYYVNEPITIKDSTLTIELNDKIIFGDIEDNKAIFTLEENANVTVLNSGEDDNGGIKKNLAFEINGGSLTIESGNFSSGFTLYNTIIANSGSLTIKGGKFSGTVTINDKRDENGGVPKIRTEISGGSFEDYLYVKGTSHASLLADGYAYANIADSTLVDGYTADKGITTLNNVKVIKHTSHSFDDATGKCGCGLVCTHENIDDSDWKCTVCGKQAKAIVSDWNGNNPKWYFDIKEAVASGASGEYIRVVLKADTYTLTEDIPVYGNVNLYFNSGLSSNFIGFDGGHSFVVEPNGGLFIGAYTHIGKVKVKADGSFGEEDTSTIDHLILEEGCHAFTDSKLSYGKFGKITVPAGHSVKDVIMQSYETEYSFRHTDGKWATEDELAATEITNVSVASLPFSYPEMNTELDGTRYNMAIYNGNNKLNLKITTKSGDIQSYRWVIDYYALGSETPTKAGEFTTESVNDFKLTGAGTYKIKCTVTSDGYSKTLTAKDIVISKGTASCTEPTANDLTYNGSEQPLVTGGTAIGGEMRYSLDGENWSADIPTATEAKTYTVYYKVIGNDNYDDSPIRNIAAEIKPAMYSDISAVISKTYDGTEALPDDIAISATLSGVAKTLTKDVDYTVTYGKYASSNAGSDIDVTLKIKLLSSNYVFEDGDKTVSEKEFTVKGSIKQAIAPDAYGKLTIVKGVEREYHLDLNTVLGKLDQGRTYGTVTYGTPDVDIPDYYNGPASINGSELTLPVRSYLYGDDIAGYVKIPVTTVNYGNFEMTVEVMATNKIIPAVTPKLNKYELTYGEALKSIAISGSGGDDTASINGTLKWSNPEYIPSAGKYTAAWVFTPDDYRYDRVNGSIDITVAKLPVSIKWNGTENLVYDGSEKAISAEVTNAVNADVVNVILGGTYSAADKGEYNASVTDVDNPNYTVEGGANINVKWSIARAQNAVENLAIDGWTYGEAAKSPNATAKFGNIVYSYAPEKDGSYGSAVPKDAGTYWVKASVEGTENYEGAESAPVSFTIARKDITGAAVGDFGLTYNGGEQTPSASVTTADGLTVTGEWSKVKNISDKTTFTANGNFEGSLADVETKMAALPINTAEITLGGALVYNGQEQTQTLEGVKAGELALTADDYDISANIGKNAGEYTLTVTGKGNFTGSAEKKFTVAQATPAESSAKKTTARLRRGKTLAEAAVTNGEMLGIDGTTVLEGTFAWVNPSAVMNSDGTAQMKFTPNDKNYGEVTFDVAISTYSSGGGGGGSSSSSKSEYTVKFETNGGSKLSDIKVSKNETVSEPTKPEKDGFEFAGWFTDKELKNKYDFSSKVTNSFTLYAAWTEKKADEEDPTDKPENPEKENPFDDVKKNDWFYEDVINAFYSGLFSGTGEKTFSPNEGITRGMFVTALYRAEGEPETAKAIPFADVSEGSYYANAVIWAEQNGIVSGVSETEFAPNERITREQIAAMMFRYAKYKEYDVTVGENTNILSYDDSLNISEYAVAAMQYAVGAGIITGKSESTLNPHDNATRAEVAAILNRFIEFNK